MNRLQCELCGNNDLVKQDGMFVCQFCGAKYTVEEAKKMMVEGTVSIDRSKEPSGRLYTLARRAKEEGNSENAAKYYSQIVEMDPDDPEAYFYSVYFQVSNCKIGEIGIAANRLSNAYISTVKLLKNNGKISNGKTDELVDYANAAMNLAQTLSSAAAMHYVNNISVSGIKIETSGRIRECVQCILKIGDSFYDLGDKENAATYYKEASQSGITFVSIDDTVLARIQEVDPDYNYTGESSGGCYIATCVYGSYDCPPVWTLRRYRDYTLAKTWYGRAFIHTYYAISPHFVKMFGDTKWFKRLWKEKLDKMVSYLQAKGIKDSPYNDIQW